MTIDTLFLCTTPTINSKARLKRLPFIAIRHHYRICTTTTTTTKPRRRRKSILAQNYTMNNTTHAGISDDIVSVTDRKTTTEKRKRPDAVYGNGKRIIKGGGEDNGDQKTVTDDEVDEFFAILKRIRVAVKYFENSRNGEGRVLRPALELPEFGGVKVSSVKGKEENLGLDLNVDPVMDGN